MKILPVINSRFNYSNNVSKYANKISYNSANNSDSVSFKSMYSESLTALASKNYNNFSEAEMVFGKMLETIMNDLSINKSPFFDNIYSLYKQIGLKDLFNLLTSPRSIKPIESIIKRSEELDSVVLAKSSEEPIFQLYNLGRKGFFQNEKNPRDIRLCFVKEKKSSPHSYLEYRTDKKNDLFLDQTYGKSYISTGFYSSNGAKKVETDIYDGGKPDTTFYNPDGTKPFFKNWFFGGTPTEGAY